MVAKLQGRPQLQSQVLHDHVALEEQQSISIYLLREARGDIGGGNQTRVCSSSVKHNAADTYVFSEDVRMGAESLRVCIPDEPDDIFHRPGGRVLVGWSLGLLGLR